MSCTISCLGPGVTIAGCEFSTWWCDVCTDGNKPGEKRKGKSLKNTHRNGKKKQMKNKNRNKYTVIQIIANDDDDDDNH